MSKTKIIFFLIFCLLLFPRGLFSQDKLVYDSQGKRNPFMPLVTKEGVLLRFDTPKNSTGIFLEGIIFDDTGVSYAIVNSEVVMTGDKINGYQVLKIEPKMVTFIKDGNTLEIKLEKEEE